MLHRVLYQTILLILRYITLMYLFVLLLKSIISTYNIVNSQLLFYFHNFTTFMKNTHMKDFTMSGSISPLRLSKYFLRSWSQCSKTNVSFLSECSTSCRRTMFLCFSSFNKQISRSADEGTPCRKGTKIKILYSTQSLLYFAIRASTTSDLA